MSKVLATIGGTALVPGVSKNRRLYTSGAVARAVARAQERIDAGDEDFTSMTHHDARDDSTRIVGRLTSMTLGEDGSARFTADIADTEHGRTIAALADNTDGKPFLKGVSIRGYWLGKVRTEKGPDGQEVSTANDVELDGIDFTKSPGVAGAKVQAFRWAGAGDQENETTERVLITETLSEARVTFTEDAAEPVALAALHELDNGACVTCEAARPMGKRGSGISGTGGPFADPGYQKDGKQRYQLDTKAHSVSAWQFISKAKNAAFYTSAQLKRIKRRIIAALKKFGVKVSTEADLAGWCFTEAAPLAELMPAEGCEDQCGSFSVNASNGPLNITLSCWQMDPADLDIIVAAAAKAAGAALKMLDPDLDGDIDVPGAGPGNDPDQDAPDETDPGDGDLDPVTTTPATAPAAGNTEERTVMTTSTETAAPAGTTPAPAAPAQDAPAAAPVVNLTQEQFTAALASVAQGAAAAAVETFEAQRRARKAAREAVQPGQPAAPAAPAQPPAVPAAPAATETDEQIVARIVAERLAADPLTAQAAAPAATPATETADQRMARLGALVDAKLTEAKQGLVASGQVSVARAGLTAAAPVSEDAAASGGAGGLNQWGLPSHFPAKPPHEYNDDERDKFLAASLTAHYLGDKADKIA